MKTILDMAARTKQRRCRFSMAVVVGPSVLAAAVPFKSSALDFSTIEFWVGSGSNRAALVVDWHDGSLPHALAWGYRWDGEADSRDLWQAVTNAGSGLSGVITNDAGSLRLDDIEYRRPTRAGDILPGTGAHDVFRTAYAWDHTGAVFRAGTWTHWTADGDPTYDRQRFAVFNGSLETRALQDDSWDAWTFSAGSEPWAPGFAMAALHYPFGYAVQGYAWGIGVTPIDWINGDPFTNAVTALGRPTVDTTGDGWFIPLSGPVPVVAVYPAFRASEMVSIGSNGFLEIAFDHAVLDDPGNPYGMDFILFGNSFQVIGGGAAWSNGNPNATLNGGGAFVERGQVFVSQDGTHWIEYADGPYADDFAPTLGRVYDTNVVDGALGPWNQWWGGATDPTIPVDPALASPDWFGISVADVARRYRGSAGGTPFDLAGLPLAPHPDTGRKWIRYVRIVRSGQLNPEVDAVADVSPALPITRWTLDAFPWLGDPADEREDADPDGDRMLNLMEYALGRDATLPGFDPEYDVSLDPMATPAALRVRWEAATNAADVVIDPMRTTDLITPDWRTNGFQLTTRGPVTPAGRLPVTMETPADADEVFIRLRVQYDE